MAGRVRGLLERLLARQRDEAATGVPDSELLRRFTHARDEAAFELLVWRYGAMVLGLCRRAVRDEQLAEDAFQAVFLVLARKSGAVRGNLGGWLFRVARRVAIRAAANRPAVQPVIETASEPHGSSAEHGELVALLDAEVARLPERLRRPVVLCYLGGHSTEDAARELGCPRGTVLSRLAAARKRLAERLTRRGVTLPAALGTAGLSSRLVSSASAAAAPFRSGAFATCVATQLANGVLLTMSRVTLLTALGGVVLAATLVGGVGWVAAQPGKMAEGTAGEDKAAPPTPVVKPAADAPKPAPPDPTDARVQADLRLKKLEKHADILRAEIDALERNVELFARAVGDTEARLAILQQRLALAEAELNTMTRELNKIEVEAAVLKKRLDDKNPPPIEAALIEEALARNPTVAAAAAELERAKKALASAVELHKEETPAIKELKRRVADHEKRVAEARKVATEEATTALRAAERAALKDKLDKLELSIQITKKLRENLKAECAALEKQIEGTRPGGANVAELRKGLEPQRELLARLQREILLARVQRDGITFTEATGTDAKLDAILKELAALRKEVQELKKQK